MGRPKKFKIGESVIIVRSLKRYPEYVGQQGRIDRYVAIKPYIYQVRLARNGAIAMLTFRAGELTADPVDKAFKQLRKEVTHEH